MESHEDLEEFHAMPSFCRFRLLSLRDRPSGRGEMEPKYYPSTAVWSFQIVKRYRLHTWIPRNSSFISALFKSPPLSIHLPHHKSVSRQRPHQDPTKQQAQTQAESDMEGQCPDDRRQAADIHQNAKLPPKRQPDEHAPETLARLVALVVAHAKLAVLQAIYCDEVFGCVVYEWSKPRSARM